MTEANIVVKRADILNAKFSIVIPTWNNVEYLKLCIKSIRQNSSFNHQLIVHINDGSDGTLQWVTDQNDIDYSFSNQNIGVCYALNSCRKLVETDYILFMNDDMYVCPGWDLALCDQINKAATQYFFISATTIEPKAQSKCSIEKDYGKTIETFEEQKLLSEFSSLPKADWQGATWPPNLVHRDIWDLAGGYSTEFSPGMYSDPDFSVKLWNLGIRQFMGVADSRVYHFGSISVKKVRKNKGYYTFIAKWGMTSSTFTKYYLHRGEPYDGELKEPLLSIFIMIKNCWKRLVTVFVRTKMFRQ